MRYVGTLKILGSCTSKVQKPFIDNLVFNWYRNEEVDRKVWDKGGGGGALPVTCAVWLTSRKKRQISN